MRTRVRLYVSSSDWDAATTAIVKRIYASIPKKPGFLPNLRVTTKDFLQKPGFWPLVRKSYESYFRETCLSSIALKSGSTQLVRASEDIRCDRV